LFEYVVARKRRRVKRDKEFKVRAVYPGREDVFVRLKEKKRRVDLP